MKWGRRIQELFTEDTEERSTICITGVPERGKGEKKKKTNIHIYAHMQLLKIIGHIRRKD